MQDITISSEWYIAVLKCNTKTIFSSKLYILLSLFQQFQSSKINLTKYTALDQTLFCFVLVNS